MKLLPTDQITVEELGLTSQPHVARDPAPATRQADPSAPNNLQPESDQ